MSKAFYDSDFTLGILGGGQLGRMLIQEAIDLNVSTRVLDPNPNAPCAEIAHEFRTGDLQDKDTVVAFGEDVDVLTIEIEHVSVEALEELERKGVQVHPQPHVLKIIQDKGLQKNFYHNQGIPTSEFSLIESRGELREQMDDLPFVQKLRKGGYDGRGVMKIDSPIGLEDGFDEPSVVEKLVDIDKELSVLVARNPSGETEVFPLVELVFDPDADLVDHLMAPADVPGKVRDQASMVARQVAETLGIIGLLAVELFLTKDGHVLVNESAPRPHNSGHHTIEASVTSQYEQHLRAILDLPLGNTNALCPAVMINLLGEPGQKGPVEYEGLEEVLDIEGVQIHLYGKHETKPYRKMGHITVLDNDRNEAEKKAQLIREKVKVIARTP